MPKALTVWITIKCGKFWKRWEYQITRPASWETYMHQEATVRTGHGTADWFQVGKGVRQGCILSPCVFNLYAEYILKNAGLEEAQAGIKIAGRNINNLRYAETPPRRWRGTKKPLDESESGKWKSWLKAQHLENEDHGIQSHHFMGNRWAKVETVSDFIFGGSKSLQMVTVAMKLKDTYSLEEKLWPT